MKTSIPPNNIKAETLFRFDLIAPAAGFPRKHIGDGIKRLSNAKVLQVLNRFNKMLFLTVALAASQLAQAQVPPSITIQPQSQTNDFNADVALTVVANGTEPLSYQWCNEAGNMADYDNMVGSQTPFLYLVGAGQQNSHAYYVIVSNAAGSVTSSVAVLTINPSVALNDGFENGLGQWEPLFDGTPLSLGSTNNHTAGGLYSAALTDSSQKMYHRLNPRQSGRVRMTMWLYDTGNAGAAYGELRGYTGASGYAKYVPPKGLRQSLAIGVYDMDFGANNKGSFAGESSSATNYQARVLSGPNAGWFNLSGPGVPGRSVGWHKFQIDRYRSTNTVSSNIDNVDFYVDDVLAAEIQNIKTADLDTVTIGSTGLGENSQWPVTPVTAWFDDVLVEVFEKSANYQNLTLHGPIPELMQLRETGTNMADVNVFPTNVVEVGGAATNGGVGTWTVTNSVIYAGEIRGYLDFAITAPADNAYRIEIEGREKDFRWPQIEIKLEVYLDGIHLGRFDLPYSASSNGLAHCFTPFIRAGPHTVSVYWDNARPRCSLALHAIRLQSLNGGSTAGNGMPTWVANRLLAQCGMESPPTASFVSPVCLEGRGLYLSMMSLTAGTNLSPIPVHAGAGERWYANVPLTPGEATTVEASYQNGGLTESNSIRWRVTNLLNATNTVIRVGDSLLFNAAPPGQSGGTATIEIEGQAPITTDAGSPVQYQFNAPGIYTVTGVYGGQSGSITVTVVGASFGNPCPARLPTWSSLWTYWDCTNLPPGVVLDADPRLEIREVSAAERQEWRPNAPPLGTNGRSFKVQTRSTVPKHIVARLGTNGPILADTAVLGFRLFTPPISDLRMISTQNDGSQVIEGTFVLSPVVPHVSLSLNLVAAGLTFEDGTLTKSLTTTNFDSLGICRLNFIRASDVKGSVCMQVNIHRDDEGSGNE